MIRRILNHCLNLLSRAAAWLAPGPRPHCDHLGDSSDCLACWEAPRPEIWTEAGPRRHFQPPDLFLQNGRVMRIVRVTDGSEAPHESD
jgi:hypothetical protein